MRLSWRRLSPAESCYAMRNKKQKKKVSKVGVVQAKVGSSSVRPIESGEAETYRSSDEQSHFSE